MLAWLRDPQYERCTDALIDLAGVKTTPKVSELRGQLETTARGNDNLMPLMVTCVENEVTLGEICHTLRGVFGEFKETATL